jgi:hypothetical protein
MWWVRRRRGQRRIQQYPTIQPAGRTVLTDAVPGWADLLRAAEPSAVESRTEPLPVVQPLLAPLMTPAARWRSGGLR